jgi:hypothetical protein
METLFVLFASWVLLRAAGRLGVRGLASWKDSGRGALAVMFVFTGASHFSAMKHDFAAMTPPRCPTTCG